MSKRRPHIVVLGAGFGGLELVTRLAEALRDEVQITLIDRSPYFTFGFSKLDVMFGKRSATEVRNHYGEMSQRGVEFRQEVVESIDPRERRIVTNAATYEADMLVVALGADVKPELTPGLLELGYEFYSNEGAERAGEALSGFTSGTVLIGVLGHVFKCPPAPSEAAMMVDSYLAERGIRDDADVCLVSPMSSPIPPSPDASAAILKTFEERGIRFIRETTVSHLSDEGVAVLEDAGEIEFDLFLGIPRHRAPEVVVEAGLTEDGWIPVDRATFATRFENVYAIGDVTSFPLPRAGVFAEGQAGALADHLIARHRNGGEPPPYTGAAACYVEFGEGKVGRVDVEFLGGPGPRGTFSEPSLRTAEEKAAFGSTRIARWFGS